MKAKLSVEDFILITPDEAIEKYDLGSELLEDIESEESMRYYDGDLIVDGDFVLDFDTDECSGVLINGDLIVDGNIIDESSSELIFNVKGLVRAKNMILETSNSYFEKGVFIEGASILDSSSAEKTDDGYSYGHGTLVYTPFESKVVIKNRFSGYLDSEKLKAILIDLSLDKDRLNHHELEFYNTFVNYYAENAKEILQDYLFDGNVVNMERLKEAVLDNKEILK